VMETTTMEAPAVDRLEAATGPTRLELQTPSKGIK